MDEKLYIGIDIGGTKCAVVLVGGGGCFYDRISFPTETQKGADFTLKKIIGSVHEIISKNFVGKARLAGIGVSCGGPLDSERGVIKSPPNLPGWDGVAITDILTEEFGLPARLENDADACARAEWRFGAGRGCSSMIFLTFGTGLGAGLILDGRLYSGACGLAGEVGHIRLAPEGPLGHGKEGSFEGFCSGGGIGRMAREALRAAGKAGADSVSAKEVVEAAKNGEKWAIEVLADSGRHLGKGLSILIDALNPEKIVIGGVYSRAREFLEPFAREVVAREALKESAACCEILPSKLGEQIGDYACVAAAMAAREAEPSGILGGLFKKYPALKTCEEDMIKAYGLMKGAYEGNKKLLLCGNGGSCSDCGHIAGELLKGFLNARPLGENVAEKLKKAGGEAGEKIARKLQGSLAAIDLTAQSAVISAVANDIDASLIYAQQIMGLAREGDVLIGLTTSGDSENVLNAFIAAKALGVKTVCLTGASGGKAKALCDVCIRVPETATPDVQELHLPLYHALCAMIEEHFFRR